MAIYGREPETANKVKGRIPIVVTDDDGDAHIHFLALAPKGMSYEDAMKQITDCFKRLRRRHRKDGDWHYGQLQKMVKEKGFKTHSLFVWEEQDDGY